MKIEISDLNGGNGGYYIAELEEPEGEVNIWGHGWYPEIDEWCTLTLGEEDYWGADPVNGWKRMRNKYYFTDKEKLSWFVIRWS